MRIPEHPNLALLILRIAAGGLMAANHGYGKLQNLIDGSREFADPIGLGAPASLALAAFAEFFCALAVAIGLFTRAAAVPLIVTMAVAGLVVHSADPLPKKELAFVYLACFTAIALLGPGRFSADRAVIPRIRGR